MLVLLKPSTLLGHISDDLLKFDKWYFRCIPNNFSSMKQILFDTESISLLSITNSKLS